LKRLQPDPILFRGCYELVMLLWGNYVEQIKDFLCLYGCPNHPPLLHGFEFLHLPPRG
jgi:hypothetical protein